MKKHVLPKLVQPIIREHEKVNTKHVFKEPEATMPCYVTSVHLPHAMCSLESFRRNYSWVLEPS